MLNLALPALAAELRPSGTQLLWISDIYVFLVAGLLPCGLWPTGTVAAGCSTLSLIRSMFQVPRQRAMALGIWTASFAIGGISVR